jgi:hypothetical protein
MKLIYEGPLLEVEVPHDEVAGGLMLATRGVVVDVSDALAESLLSQGEENADQIPLDPETGEPERDPQHNRTWRKATAKEIQAADKAAAKAAGEADAAGIAVERGDEAGDS